METNARHLLIGSFVLAGMLSILGFIAWMTGIELTDQVSSYNIDFEESVAGLSVGGDVRYRGIKIGTVAAIEIHPRDPRLARVTVEVGSTVIRQGDRATLVLQGITGVLFVNIEGAEAGSHELTAVDGEPLPIIPAQPSALAAIFEGTPNLMTQAAVILDKTTNLLDGLGELTRASNRELIEGILGDMQTITSSAAAHEEAFGRIVGALDRSSHDIEEGMARMHGTLDHAERLLADEVPELVEEYRATGVSIRRLADGANSMLEETREPLRRFSGEGLANLARVTAGANRLLARLGGLIERLESEGLATLAASPVRELDLGVER